VFRRVLPLRLLFLCLLDFLDFGGGESLEVGGEFVVDLPLIDILLLVDLETVDVEVEQGLDGLVEREFLLFVDHFRFEFFETVLKCTKVVGLQTRVYFIMQFVQTCF